MSLLLTSSEQFDTFLRQQAAAIYFSGADCSVCHALRPKVEALLAERFPRIALGRVECAATPALAAQQGVFAVPTLLVFFDGQELLRKSRAFSPAQLADELERPYALFFGV